MMNDDDDGSCVAGFGCWLGWAAVGAGGRAVVVRRAGGRRLVLAAAWRAAGVAGGAAGPGVGGRLLAGDTPKKQNIWW